MSKKLKIGIIGVGGAGRAHSSRFLSSPQVSHVRGFDIKKIEFDSIPIFYDFEEFIEPLDAVSICTPDDTHFEYIIKAFEKGKHVLVEKPMVASLEEAFELKEAIEKNGHLKFAVHHQMRFVPAFSKAKRLIESGELGKIFYAEANYWHDMRQRSVKYDDWRMKGKGQSVIYGGACHPLDLLLHLFGNGDAPVKHTTYLNKIGYPECPAGYTSATTILTMQSGAVCKCHTNNAARFPQFNNLILLGENGSYVDGILHDGKSFHEVASASAYRGHFRRLVRHLSKTLLALCKRIPAFRFNPWSVYDHNYACEVIVNNFVDCIVEGKEPLVGYNDGLRVIRVCEETEEDGYKNSTVG